MLTRNDSLKSTRNCYPNQNTVKYIVVHYTACDAPARNFALSQMNNDLSGSAHDFIDSTSWYCSIDHKHGAWSVGDNQGYGTYPNGITNFNSLNIEMVAPPWQLPSAKTIENTAEIVAYYMKIYNVPISRVVRHYDASYKQCPYGMHGENNPNWNNFKAKVQAYYNGTATNAVANNQKQENGVNRSMYIFSKNWYLKAYPDVAKSKAYKDDPYLHYEKYGKKEGRKPLPPIPAEFCEGDYLELNPDVAEAVKKGVYVSGIHHYLMYGFNEKRKINKTETEEALKKRVETLEKELKEEKERVKKVKDIVNE